MRMPSGPLFLALAAATLAPSWASAGIVTLGLTPDQMPPGKRSLVTVAPAADSLVPTEVAVVGSGQIVGTFNDAGPSSGTFTIAPPNRIIWGEAVIGSSPNSLEFPVSPFAKVAKGKTFVAGELAYFNGTIAIGTEITSVELFLQSSSEDPAFVASLPLAISVLQTPNTTGSAEGDADFIYFTDYPEFGSFRVFENAGTSVQVLAEFGSLTLRGFGTVANPALGFVSPSVQVPEPSSIVLMALAGAGAFVVLRRRRA